MKPVEPDTAEFSVFCPGMLEVLSIGRGDLKLQVGGDSPEDREKARNLIEEMLRKGYAIFVEMENGPVRVKTFDPRVMCYVIGDQVDLPAPDPKDTTRPKGRKAGTRQVPVAGSRATAVGRTAGG